MKKPSICVITSELSGLNVRVIEALKKSDDFEIINIIYAEKNSTFKIAFLRRKIKKIIQIGILGAALGFWTRDWFRIKSDHLEDVCVRWDLRLEKVKFLNGSATRGLLALYKPTFILSLGNGYIKTDILNLADLCALNIHLESLPNYPGARSIIWRLFNSETRTGYAVHAMNSKIDKGFVFNNFETDIHFRPTLKETISYNIENLIKSLEENISQIILNISDNCQSSYFQDMHQQALTRSYTTPSFSEFLQIWFKFYSLRNKQK